MKRTCEISVYNKEVRAAIQAGRPHPPLNADWADVYQKNKPGSQWSPGLFYERLIFSPP